VPSATVYAHRSGVVTWYEARGSRRRLRVLARSSVRETRMIRSSG
jgi:hypothetical protein